MLFLCAHWGEELTEGCRIVGNLVPRRASSDVDAVRLALEGLERTLDLLYELGEGSIVERQKASLFEAVRPLVDHHELQTFARSSIERSAGILQKKSSGEGDDESNSIPPTQPSTLSVSVKEKKGQCRAD